MIFNHLEALPEVIEEGPDEPEDLEEIIRIEGELTISLEPRIEEPPEYDVPEDAYLEQLEQLRQEELAAMLPRRIP